MSIQRRLKNIGLQSASLSEVTTNTYKLADIAGSGCFDYRSWLDRLGAKELGRARSLFTGPLLLVALAAAAAMLACAVRLGDFGLHLVGNTAKQSGDGAAAQPRTGQRNGRKVQR